MESKAKVTINPPSPSQEIVAKPHGEATVRDSTGRTITLKKPGVLAQYRIVEVVGDSAKNEAYMAMVLPLLFVSAIDGDVLFQPTRKSELEALIQRLDEAGIEAVMQGVAENFGKPNPDADKERLKN